MKRPIASYKCKCNLCARHREIERLKRRGTRKQLVKLIDELSDWAMNVSSDADYYAAIMDGSWPTAVEQLTSALKKARRLRVKR